MEDLVDSMTSPNPADRPRIEDVIRRFTEIRNSLSQIKSRSALTSKMAPWIVRATQERRQNIRTIQYIISRKAAIPDL